MKASHYLTLAAAPALLFLAACGGDSDDPAENADDAGVAPVETPVADDGAEAEPVASAECPATDLAGTTPSGAAFTGSSAVAANIQNGAAYTLYLADFELTTDSFSLIRNPEAPADGVLWTVAVTIFNAAPEDIVPIEAGAVVEADRPFGELTFTVTANEGEAFYGSSSGQQGTVTVTQVGTVFCGTIEYSDDEKSISGTFQAPTKAL